MRLMHKAIAQQRWRTRILQICKDANGCHALQQLLARSSSRQDKLHEPTVTALIVADGC